MNGNIELSDGIALIGGLGALAAAYAALQDQGASGSQQPVFNIPEGFGQSDETDGDNSETDPPTFEDDTAADRADESGADEWQWEEGTETWDDDEFDFGGDGGGLYFDADDGTTSNSDSDESGDGWNYEDGSEIGDDWTGG